MNQYLIPAGLLMSLAVLVAGPAPSRAFGAPAVSLVRTPNGGIQPQVVVDQKGLVHLLYYKGDASHGDLFYVRSRDAGENYSSPLRVNSQPGSAIAMGNIRGGQIAIGKDGAVHVAWNGSSTALPPGPRAPGESAASAPMLYSRMLAGETTFEPQRNLMKFTYELDGGGSVAADNAGDVYVAWHASAHGIHGEAQRQVWVAASHDNGRTFTPERAAWQQPTGVCGCCGLRIFVDRLGRPYILYRSATHEVNRDMYLLAGNPGGQGFKGTVLGRWRLDACPMSSESFTEGRSAVYGAWESQRQVYYSRIDPTGRNPTTTVSAPGPAADRKYPSVAVNNAGQVLLAWTEGMAWDRGGAAAWQVFTPEGQPIPGASGRADGVPAWSLVAAFARPDGSFVVVY